MYTILTHVHSGLRWIVLLTLLVAIVNAIGKTNGNRAYLQVTCNYHSWHLYLRMFSFWSV